MKTTAAEPIQSIRTIRSGILPGEIYTCPLRVIFHESHSSTEERPEYVTHLQNMQTGELFSGHYFNGRGLVQSLGVTTEQANNMAKSEALKDYAERCHSLRMDPIPSADVQAIPAGKPRPAAGDLHTCNKCGQQYEVPTVNWDGLCPDCASEAEAHNV